MARATTSKPKSRSEAHSDEHARQFAWLDWALGRTGKTDSSLAEEAGLAKNYLYRKRADGTVIGPTQIRQICDHFGLPGPDTYQAPGAAGLSDEGTPFDASRDSSGKTAATIAGILKGRPNAASWTLKTRALESAGYMLGDIVVSDSSAAAMAGDAVVAQVYDLRTGTAETIFRLFEPPYLVAASSDPALRKPLLIDNESVIVIGPITESLRARRPS